MSQSLLLVGNMDFMDVMVENHSMDVMVAILWM